MRKQKHAHTHTGKAAIIGIIKSTAEEHTRDGALYFEYVKHMRYTGPIRLAAKYIHQL